MDEKKPKSDSPDLIIIVILALAILVLLGGTLGGMFSRYEDLIAWFQSAQWRRINLIAAFIFLPFNIFLIGFIITVVRRYQRLILKPIITETAPHAATPLPEDEVGNNWTQIRELANSTNPSDWNMAILRADALLDDVLEYRGYQGATLAERLKVVDPTNLPSMERVWSAHHLRNAIAHDPLEQHTKETIIHALRSYEQALKELGTLKEA